MRFGCGALFLLGLAGCTAYQPIDWNDRAGLARARSPGAGDQSVRRHQVANGETLSELALRYQVPMRELARANGIAKPYRLNAGQLLTVPSAGGMAPETAARAVAVVIPANRTKVAIGNQPVPPRSKSVQVASLGDETAVPQLVAPLPSERLEASRGAADRAPPSLSGDGFLWPVRGKIASAFGGKPNGTRNDGINIRAAEGTAVVAAENGIVVFAGDEIPGYGRMLLISHANGFLTAYAHNRDLLVSVGDRVERGQRVAKVGRTGNVSSPQLHFELRDGKEPLDPVELLDAARTQVASVR